MTRIGLQMKKDDLFDTSGPAKTYHPAFIAIRKSRLHDAARDLMNDAFHKMGDPDGNFVEQFQTTGFHSRLFELCCYNFLDGEGLVVERSSTPDFIVRGPLGIASVEATTSNHANDPYADISIHAMEKLGPEALEEKVNNDLPIKLGSALFSKLNKRYWEHENCKNRPLVFVIGPFHEAGSMFYSASSLAGYLYGLKQSFTWSANGDLVIHEEKVRDHVKGTKIIPSHFFGQPNSENVSGVVYSNSFTVAKFLRMSIQQGFRPDAAYVIREGFCIDHNPNAANPKRFKFDVCDPNAPPEDWGQGASLFLNPNAKNPLPEDFFKTTMVNIYDGKNVVSSVASEFWPLISTTQIIEKE